MSIYHASRGLAGLFMLLLCLPAVAAQPGLLSEKLQHLEYWQMRWLAQTRQKAPQALAAFSTDGCSGGLSEGWKYMSSSAPAFQQRWGNLPPWEACCVAHDRVYWQGETDNGYRKRLQADMDLRQCVIDTGRRQSAALVRRYRMSPQKLQKNFQIAADLMFRAVRLGGQPCSLLPWGYGWPYCRMDALPRSQTNSVK
ncbi:MAG: hypothetical protein KZQ58_02125 [gamma proteobacterium symbiont of Bathyaustriella thionipta]|nr:hypothetical protein [gamma proteobacterium symbiont of Bathyaustriella thionipta]